MPRGQESRLLCTAEVQPHSRRATGLIPSGDSQVGRGPAVLRAAGVSGRGPCGQSRGNLLHFNSQPHCAPAPAAALDRAALRNGQVPTPAARATCCLLHLRRCDGAERPSSTAVWTAEPAPDVSPSGCITSAAPHGAMGSDQQSLPAPAPNTSACDPPGACSHRQVDRCSACPQTGETCLPSSEAEFLMENSPCSPTGCKSTFLGPHGNFTACSLYPVL